MASNTPFQYNGSSVIPGAYMINSGGGSFPIFCSINNYQTFKMTNGSSPVDNYYIIMPGYKIIVYNSSNAITLEQLNGTNNYPIIVTPSTIDSGLSCKLFIYVNNQYEEVMYNLTQG